MLILKLFLSFAKVGLLGFGGGLSIVRLIYDSIQSFVPMTAEEFANIVAISQITPGPLAVNVATFVGYETAGFGGAFVATLGVVTPAFVIVSIVCRMVQRFNDSRLVKGALTGVKPMTIGLIASAMVTLAIPTIAGEGRLGRGFIDNFAPVMAGLPVDILSILMVAATVILVAKFKKKPIFILLVMGCIGALLGV